MSALHAGTSLKGAFAGCWSANAAEFQRCYIWLSICQIQPRLSWECGVWPSRSCALS